MLVLKRKHNPHQELLLVGSLITGAAYSFGAPPPASVSALLPVWQVHVWAAAMFVSGVAGMAGCYWRGDYIVARRLESGGMELGASVMLAYAGYLFAVAGGRALGAGVTFALWAAANLWRSVQIHQELKEVARK